MLLKSSKAYTGFEPNQNDEDSVLCAHRLYSFEQPLTGECDDFDFTEYSSGILAFKNCELSVIEISADCISSNIGNDFDCLAVVPPHHNGVDNSGIKILCQEICKRKKLVDITQCLIRERTIEKVSTGGDRSIETHLQSIKIVNKELIEGKKLLVLDDVSTTGNSLKACQKLLESAAAKSVKGFVLGKTTRYLEDLDFFCCQYDIINENIQKEERELDWELIKESEINHYAIEYDYKNKNECLLEDYYNGNLSNEDFSFYESELDQNRYESYKEIDEQNTAQSYWINSNSICQTEALDNLYIFSFSSLPKNCH